LIDIYQDNETVPHIHTQHDFNRVVAEALRNLYLLSIKAVDCGEDIAVRGQIAALDCYANGTRFVEAVPVAPEVG